MPPEVKFCGLTRPVDAELASALGASYVGVILVGGPRLLTPTVAQEVLQAATGPRRVAVVPRTAAAQMAALGRAVGADILQVHADPTPAELAELRTLWDGGVWAVARLGTTPHAETLCALFAAADAVVVDTLVPGGLGGSGHAFDWERHAPLLATARARTPIVLAGGLTADNISEAVRVLGPDVVDVSSGVEDAPALKSPAKMRRFALAVASPIPKFST